MKRSRRNRKPKGTYASPTEQGLKRVLERLEHGATWKQACAPYGYSPVTVRKIFDDRGIVVEKVARRYQRQTRDDWRTIETKSGQKYYAVPLESQVFERLTPEEYERRKAEENT